MSNAISRVWSKRARKKPKNRTGDMSLVEHLQELRKRLIIAVVAFILATTIGFVWYQWAPPGVMTLGEIIRGPYCSLPPETRADFTPGDECRLLATSPIEMLMLRLKVAAVAGLILSSPVWLYQIWAFVTPGLYKTERRWTLSFVGVAVLLFVSGALLAYLIVDRGLEFLVTIGGETQVAALTGESYFNFVLALIVIFGVSFEVPLFIVMLNIVDVLRYQDLKEKRRIIILLVFVFSALLTPSGDAYSMLVLAFAVGILVELAIQFCRINDKRRGIVGGVALADLDDEEASELEYTPEPVEPAASVKDPEPTRRRNTAETDYFDDVL